MEEIQKIRLKLGTKKFDSAFKEASEKRSFKRANKNRQMILSQMFVEHLFKDIFRPREMSSKHPVPLFREVVTLQKKEERGDPRFDERAGRFSKDLFSKSYSFIEEMKKEEKQQVLRETKKTHNPEKKKKLQRLLQQMVRFPQLSTLY